jgi:hypothetical protein
MLLSWRGKEQIQILGEKRNPSWETFTIKTHKGMRVQHRDELEIGYEDGRSMERYEVCVQ